MHNKNISWAILAGGQASRMGGTDKGLIELNGRPLIEIVYTALQRQVDNICINANRNQGTYQVLAPVIEDKITGFQGPLAGIHSCLSEADSDWVGFTPCDSPNIPHDLVSRLVAGIAQDIDIVVAHDGQHAQPVFSLWNTEVLPKLTRFLEQGDRKIKLLLAQCRVEFIDFSDIPNTFVNLNTPEELKEFGSLND